MIIITILIIAIAVKIAERTAEESRKRTEELNRKIERERLQREINEKRAAAEREKLRKQQIKESEIRRREFERQQKQIETLAARLDVLEVKAIQAQNTLEYVTPEIERITERLNHIDILPQNDKLDQEKIKLEKQLYTLNNKAIKADYDINRYAREREKLKNMTA